MFSNQNRCEYHAAPIKQFRFSSLGLCDIEFSYQNVGVDRRVLRLCRNPGLNQGPLDLQSNALPTELFRPTIDRGPAHHQYRIQVVNDMSDCTPKDHEVRPSRKCVSIGGSVVECSPATRAARVRFPADATFDSNTISKLKNN